MSSVGSRWRSSAVLALQLAGGRRRAARKSAGAAAISRTWAPANSAPRGLRPAASAVSTSMRRTPARLRQGDVGGDQGDLGAAPGRGGGEGDAHAAAGAVADEADRVDRLAGAAGGDQDPQAVPGALARRQRRLDPGQQALGVGQAAAAELAARGELALVGLDHLDPALAQRRQVRLGRRVGVHAVVHRRRDQARRRAGEEGGGEHRVGDAGGELGDRVGRGRRDQEGVAVGGQLEVADRVVAGLARRRGRRRASGRARTRRSSTGAPTIPSKEAAPTKRVAVSVISTRTPCPARVARRASSSDL